MAREYCSHSAVSHVLTALASTPRVEEEPEEEQEEEEEEEEEGTGGAEAAARAAKEAAAAKKKARPAGTRVCVYVFS